MSLKRPKSMRKSLNRFIGIRSILAGTRYLFLTKVWGMDIHPTCILSLSSKFDFTYPAGVHIGEKTYIAFEARILCHDRTRGIYAHTRIGKNCFIGGRSLIMPNVQIGDGSIVGAGSIVTKNVPAGSIVAGNPASIILKDVKLGEYGRYLDADERTKNLIEEGIIG